MASEEARLFAALDPQLQTIHVQVNYRSRVKRKHLTHHQAAYDADPERTPQFRTGAGRQRQRQSSKKRRHCRHHDRTESQQAGLINRFLGRLPCSLGFDREIDHHDGVLFHDADQQNDSDQRDHG